MSARSFRTFICGLFIVLALAGCSTAGDTGAPIAATAPAAAPATSAPTSAAVAVPTVTRQAPTGTSFNYAGRELVVFAAASLTEPFTEIGQQFEKSHPGLKVMFNFAGSPQLRTQIEQGAKADLFASANQSEIDTGKKNGIIAGQEKIFANNKLVVITPKSNPGNVQRLQDLARPGLKFVTSQPNVPVGAYTVTALEKMSADPAFGAAFKDAVQKNIISQEADVKQIVAKVQLGEADAGVVYSTDVSSAVSKDVNALVIPDQFNTIAVYPIALIKDAKEAGLAQEFIHYVTSADGQAILKKGNFITVE
jgi:molybdate transport system substrate-binding protein